MDKLQKPAILVVDMLNDFVTGALTCDRAKAIVGIVESKLPGIKKDSEEKIKSLGDPDESVEVQDEEEPVAEPVTYTQPSSLKLEDIKDEDMMAAALVATIDYHEETKEDVENIINRVREYLG